ncbi:substrate-binding domain-containing protein [Pararobbsia alpina]|uniref:HTH-type transcriptional repressor PurR n=1 Tax=Pararobbsia alpina TaxID=621374 RepID=A0A6S7B7C5_9BURK|nr:substrate-binding domain-containing protein [Pararobbsia alpina]CAB3790399.1 HTH-type transcriptional repressor PurR [Pararobbsia alpina]
MGIKKLASHLNLSIATVSRALNASDEVSAATRQRVLEAAAELGYSPNKAAESLRKGRIDTIGLMLPMRNPEENYTLSLFLTLADGIQAVLAQHQLDLAIYQSNSDEDELGRLRRIVERRQVDGLIVSGTRRHDARLDYLAKQKFPFVAFGRSDSGGDHAWLDLDFEAAAQEAIARLVGFRHQRIAIGMPGQDAMQAHVYLKGYKRALRHFGLRFDASLALHDELSERGGYRITERLLASPTPPTAILFQSDCMAIGAYRKLSELGLRPGKDIAISGGVLTGEMPDYLSPRLTGFSIPVRELGMRMAEAILARLPGTRTHDKRVLVQEVWPLQFKARSSDASEEK